MTDRIIEIADTAAYLSLKNQLLKIQLPTGRQRRSLFHLKLYKPQLTALESVTDPEYSTLLKLYKPQLHNTACFRIL